MTGCTPAVIPGAPPWPRLGRGRRILRCKVICFTVQHCTVVSCIVHIVQAQPAQGGWRKFPAPTKVTLLIGVKERWCLKPSQLFSQPIFTSYQLLSISSQVFSPLINRRVSPHCEELLAQDWRQEKKQDSQLASNMQHGPYTSEQAPGARQPRSCSIENTKLHETTKFRENRFF